MPLPFVGVDGEGGNLDDGSHTYHMLRIGDRYVTNNFLDFIALAPNKHIYVSFFFDYDVTMMLRHLPEQTIRTLLDAGEAWYGRYRLAYRARKEFTVRAHGTQTTINDVGTFFQSAFITALKRWQVGTPEQLEAIGDGKEQRANFGPLTPEIIHYNQLECLLLVELMEKFRRACSVIGYLPRRWQGPGQLAKAMLKAHNVPTTDQLPEPNLAGIWEAAQAAYYGGRFETSAVGPVNCEIDSWDIGSAYPYATTQLPCLQHVTWHPSKEIVPEGLYKVDYTHNHQMWYTLPHRRRDGSICYPRSGAGWYWGIELLAAMQAGCQPRVRHGYQWHSTCQHRLFDFMHRLYSVRKSIGKTEAGWALKLAMNSVYGVTAQSIGRAPYANPIYAGLITAITRAKLLDAIRHSPNDVFMLATDGLYCRSGALPLEESSSLGGWELTRFPSGMYIVQPGVYFVGHKSTCEPGGNCDCHPKTRGVPLRVIERDEADVKAAWRGDRTDGHPVQLRQFIGLRLAAARGKLDTAGTWADVTKTITYDWVTKRNPRILRHTDVGYRTEPYADVEETESTPYRKLIGGNLIRDMDKLEFLDAPDWAERLTEI